MDITKEIEALSSQSSLLFVCPIEHLADSINQAILLLSQKKLVGTYVSFNKPYKSLKKKLDELGVDTSKILFIDCIASSIGEAEQTQNVVHIHNPSDLTSLMIAINEFGESIASEKYLVIDALATLLIYNREELVIKFVKSILEDSLKHNLKVLMFTPDAKGSEFVNKISLFFDNIVRA